MSVRAIGWAFKQHTGSSSTKLTLFKLADAADDFGVCFISAKYIGEQTEQRRSTVYKHLKVLVAMGLVKRTKVTRMNEGTGRSYLVDGFQLALSKPLCGNPSLHRGNARLPGGRRDLHDRQPYNEPSSEASLKPAFIAPGLTARVERLKKLIGEHCFASWFQDASFLDDGPTIDLPSRLQFERVTDKYMADVSEALGSQTAIKWGKLVRTAAPTEF